MPYGIGAKKEELTLQLYPSTNSGASSFSKSLNFNISFSWIRKKIYGTQIAKVIKFDDHIDIFDRSIKLIKIDIEGFEFEALKGAEQCLKRGIFENILIEIHPTALSGLNQSKDQINEYLLAHGYSKKTIIHNLNLYTLQ